MEVRKIATKALELYAYKEGDQNRTAKQVALVGFFRGIAEGRITVGQDWPIDILLNHTSFRSIESFTLLEQIFGSGMLSQGQQLGQARQR